VGRTDLRPVLDFETHASALSGAQMIAWARRFNSRVHERLGLFPIFYTYPAFLSVRPDKPIGSGLWLASYSKNDGKDHPFSIPRPWKKVVAHQFTSQGRLPGHAGHIDLSHADSLRSVLAHPVLGL
jgi:GH25 family lysozyme M1 (1,4-beta-N-acetylmuramidase)